MKLYKFMELIKRSGIVLSIDEDIITVEDIANMDKLSLKQTIGELINELVLEDQIYENLQ